MPRPRRNLITFTIDGREVQAPENAMLVDAAKHGDVEIPVFCYEPKLGGPVGACRMCLVEIEGIPKLQAGCATPVKDGMVVNTQSQRVREAQQAVVEFLLINHPLDCPVCDKGGECPLQDITFGWGAGTSRFIEPKRHFKKPLELSPLVAIDRERCILCYRCVRFSQEISEDYQLVLHERGAHSFVGTFDGHPYVAPFSGNIIELCPVGALTSSAYRFRARPWDIEGSGTICTLCPAQCNVELTVRDDRVMRVMSRQNPEVDDGWLCDKGRFAYQSIHVDERIVEPMVRDGGRLRPVGWDRALDEAAAILRRAGSGAAAIAGGGASNEEGFLLQRIFRDVLGSSRLSCGPLSGLPEGLRAALAAPALQARVSDLEFAHAVFVLGAEPVDDAPIVDLRIRKGMRRNRVQLTLATSRPSSLDPSAAHVARYAPGGGEAFLCSLDAALAGGDDTPQDARDLADRLRAAGPEQVVVVSERVLSSPNAARALLNIADRLGLASTAGAGLLVLPSASNGRGLAEAGVTGGLGDDAPAALHLLHADLPAGFAGPVIAHAAFLTADLEEHATVVFPAESYAEKEGTITHPDGRLQRLRPAIGHPRGIRAEWSVLVELAKRLGRDLDVLTGSMASSRLFATIPFYAGLTLEEIGGLGVRWQERDAASAAPAADAAPFRLEPAAPVAEANGRLRVGGFRSIWAGPEVAASPALKFLVPQSRLELSPEDARRLGIEHGGEVEVGTNGTRVRATASLRAAIPAGSAFLEGADADGSPAEVRPA